MRYLIYKDLSPNGNIVEVKISEQEAIEVQRNSALHKSYAYASDAEALADFMTVHWAFFEARDAAN